MSYRNRDFLRNLAAPGLDAFGARIVEALDDIDGSNSNLAQQVNGNATGNPKAPAAIARLDVTAQNGHFQIAITDNSPIFRDIHYWVEHADNVHFISPHVIHMGQSRNFNLFLGNVTRYFRAYSSYASSPPSAPAYHGGRAQPVAVTGGGSVGGPAFLPSQGSGTGLAGTGLQGPGTVPFRSANGAAPSR